MPANEKKFSIEELLATEATRWDRRIASDLADSPEWRREGELLTAIAVRVFESAGLDREQAINALQILRALVRGFVLHEMSASFLDTVDYDQIYAVAVDVFIRGLDALRSSAQPA